MDAACKGEAPAFKSARTEETSPCLADQKSAVVPPLPLHSLEEAAEMTQKYLTRLEDRNLESTVTSVKHGLVDQITPA